MTETHINRSEHAKEDRYKVYFGDSLSGSASCDFWYFSNISEIYLGYVARHFWLDILFWIFSISVFFFSGLVIFVDGYQP